MEPNEIIADRHSVSEQSIREIIIDTWKELLQAPRVGPEDNLLLLGGESLLATQASVRLRERYGWDIPLRSILVNTVAEIATEIMGNLQITPPRPTADL